MSRARSIEVLAHRLGDSGRAGRTPVRVVVEEPLEIRVADDVMATTMRTPGDDFELAAGWCWAEGLISRPPTEIRYCATGSALDTQFNVVTVDPDPDAPRGPLDRAARLNVVSASCGVCGAPDLDELTDRLALVPDSGPIALDVLTAAGDAASAHQALFGVTGGSHAAAAISAEGEVIVVREDIGRHNAVDKVVGRLLLDGAVPASGQVLWVSGRGGFELVQKAWAAGFAALVAVGAPSAMAVRTAERAGLLLAGFARGGDVTVYACADRLAVVTT